MWSLSQNTQARMEAEKKGITTPAATVPTKSSWSLSKATQARMDAMPPAEPYKPFTNKQGGFTGAAIDTVSVASKYLLDKAKAGSIPKGIFDDIALGIGQAKGWCGNYASTLSTASKVGDNWSDKINKVDKRSGIKAGDKVVLPLGVVNGKGYGHVVTAISDEDANGNWYAAQSNADGRQNRGEGLGVATYGIFNTKTLQNRYGNNWGGISGKLKINPFKDKNLLKQEPDNGNMNLYSLIGKGSSMLMDNLTGRKVQLSNDKAPPAGLNVTRPDVLAKYVLDNNIGDLQQKKWWVENPVKNEAWDLIGQKITNDPTYSKSKYNAVLSTSTGTGIKLADENGATININAFDSSNPVVNPVGTIAKYLLGLKADVQGNVNVRDLNPFWSKDDEIGYQNQLARERSMASQGMATPNTLSSYFETGAGKMLQGLTGGILKYKAPKEDVVTDIGGFIMEQVGAITTAGGLSKAATGIPLIKGMLGSQNSLISRYVGPALANALGWGAYGQLDPMLGDTATRMEKFVKDASFGAALHFVGGIKGNTLKAPLEFATFYGFAKLDGASDKEALAAGAVGVAMGGFFRSLHSPGTKLKAVTDAKTDAEMLLRDRAATILGVDSKASPEEIKKAWRKAAAAVHPDRGGDVVAAAQVNAAYDILTGKNKIIETIKTSYEKSNKEMVKYDRDVAAENKKGASAIFRDAIKTYKETGQNGAQVEQMADYSSKLAELQQKGKKEVLTVLDEKLDEPALSISTYTYSDGKTGVTFTVNTTDLNITQPMSGAYDSPREAVKAAVGQIEGIVENFADIPAEKIKTKIDDLKKTDFASIPDEGEGAKAFPDMIKGKGLIEKSTVSTPESREKASRTYLEGGLEKKKSTGAAAKLMEAEGLGEQTYMSASKPQDAIRGEDLVNKQMDFALKIMAGEELPPEGVTYTGVVEALIGKVKLEGNDGLYQSALAALRNYRGGIAQELALGKMSDPHSSDYWVSKALEQKASILRSRYILKSDLVKEVTVKGKRKTVESSPLEAAEKAFKREKTKFKKFRDKSNFWQDNQSFLDSLICKS